VDFSLILDSDGRPQASLGSADELHNAILLSLHVRRGSFFLNPDFGSRLHEIHTLSDSDIALARQYVVECLEWLKTINRVSNIDVSAMSVRGGKLNLVIVLSRNNRTDIIYETFYKVV
jgi:phage gp46-like protein